MGILGEGFGKIPESMLGKILGTFDSGLPTV